MQCHKRKKNDNYGKKTHNGAKKKFEVVFLYSFKKKDTFQPFTFVGKTCDELVHTVILEYFNINVAFKAFFLF